MRAAILALLLIGCTDELPPPELITDLRILAVRAEPPEGMAGTDIAFDALVAGNATLTYWACIAAGGPQEGPEDCAASPPTVACADAPEAASCTISDAHYVLPTQAFAGRAANEDGQVFIILKAGPRIAAKRIAVTRAPSTRTNPIVSDLVIAGADVSVSVPSSGDDLFLSWYVTTGAMDDFRTNATGDGLHNRWTPPEQPGTMYVVVRDGVGGESWVMGSR